MDHLILTILLGPALALALYCVGGIKPLAGLMPKNSIRWVSFFTLLQLLIAIGVGVAYIAQLTISSDHSPLPWSTSQFGFSVYLDGVSSLMFLMVSFVGWVICRYSVRYLDGDSSQAQYFRWAGLTIGAVSMMVLSGNLLMFLCCWVLTSFGLHHLLMHFPDRPAARRAAWSKFVVSRIADGALAIALLMIYRECGTLQIASLFRSAADGTLTGASLPPAACLIVFAAVLKSAQFPFHTWLPQTLETPTPVSALMHAGIVNAGGYLVIRTSPILSVAPWALTALALIGATTTLFAGMVMLTQTSVKKTLAYSTIAQMGFMMLQCGLGAFSAAMLHLLAHSMYKAYAFLNSGNIIAEQSLGGLQRMLRPDGSRSAPDWKITGLAGVYTLTVLTTAFALLGINLLTKPGGLILGSVLSLALAHWIGQVDAEGRRKLTRRSFAVAAGLCVAYAMTYALVDSLVATSVPAVVSPLASWIAIASIVVGGFTGLMLIERSLISNSTSSRFDRWYVHASNGFYLESLVRRNIETLRTS